MSATRVSPVTIRLEPTGGEISEEVTVTAAAPLIDVNTPEMGTIELRERDIEILPITRTATGLIELTPGARPSQVWGGSTSQANLYWLEELQVKGLGTGAEYGDFQGGLINMVTKSGSNTLEGGIRLNYQDADLNGSNLTVDETGDERDSRWEPSFDLGGPLVRDDLFAFLDSVPTGQEVGPAVDYSQPFVDQWVVGLERVVASDWRLGVTYVNREWQDILALVDRNLDSNDTLLQGVLLDEDSVTAVKTLVNEQAPDAPTTVLGAVRGRQAPRTVRLDVAYRW